MLLTFYLPCHRLISMKARLLYSLFTMLKVVPRKTDLFNIFFTMSYIPTLVPRKAALFLQLIYHTIDQFEGKLRCCTFCLPCYR